MSRIPGANSSGIPPPATTKRLSRQPSLDLRRRKHHPDQAPPPVPALKSSKSSRLSRTSISSYDEVESPTSAVSRYSLSSFGSAGTAMTSPRTSFTTSPKPTIVTTRQRPQSKQPPSAGPISPIQRSNSSNGQLRVGERVAVDSMGIVGTLQFLGTTRFKEGIWAGIQLDIVGTGKNDGSVRGIRYFACPPETGLFVQASKVASLNDGIRSPSPPTQRVGSRAARYVGMTASQLTRSKRSSSSASTTRSAAGVRRSVAAPPASVQSPTPTRRSTSSNNHGTTEKQHHQHDGIPSPAMTPTNHSLHDEFDDEMHEMLTDTPVPANLPSTNEEPSDPHARLERMLGEAISQAPDQAVMRLQQLQVRVEVLEAENKFLKLENAQNKTAEQILERSVVLRKSAHDGKEGGEAGNENSDESYFTLEGHKAIVEEIKQEHEQKSKSWDQEKEHIQSTIKKLEHKVTELEQEQQELKKERDQLQEQVTQIRKEKVAVEHRVQELEQQVTMAEANVAALQASKNVMTTSNFYSDDPGEMRERQMQMEIEMEEVHEKMASLMESMRAKDMFLGTLSEQVEMHRNMAEEREREVRRTKADCDRHQREKERLREEVQELEEKWLQHQNCASQDEYNKLKSELSQAKEHLNRETANVEDYRKRIEQLDQSVEELKKAGMESIELYESSVELHRVDMEAINARLMDEQRKVNSLESEREELRKAGVEAIEAYEATMEELKKEMSSTSDKQTQEREELHNTIAKLKQEIEQLVNARDKSDEVEKIKSVWESERQRLMENIEINAQAIANEKQQYETLKNEADKLRDQVKQSDKLAKENEKLQEQATRLQGDYEEQRSMSSKYLQDVRVAVESQKKTEGELRRLNEAKEKAERDLQTTQESLHRAEGALTDLRKYGADTDSLTKEREQRGKELTMLRQEIEKLEAQNAMLSKQKQQAELLLSSSGDANAGDNKKQVESLQTENKRLTKEIKTLGETHKQVQNECMKLMEEVEKLHSEEPAIPSGLDDCQNDQERIERLQKQLDDAKRQIEVTTVKQNTELRQLKEKQADEERAHQQQLTALNRDIADLESLIESKIFKEADLEEALEKERKQASRLKNELTDMKQTLKQQQQNNDTLSKSSSSSSSNGPHTDDGPFCEICEVAGHTIYTCKAVLPPSNSNTKNTDTERPYCENCDDYGLHTTIHCPNQNETY